MPASSSYNSQMSSDQDPLFGKSGDKVTIVIFICLWPELKLSHCQYPSTFNNQLINVDRYNMHAKDSIQFEL